MDRPRWILEIHPDFTDPARLVPLVQAPILLDATAPDSADQLPADVAGPLVAFGSLRRMHHLLRLPGLADAVLDQHAELRCSRYYRHVYPWLGRTAVLVPLCALPHLPLARLFGEAVFVRPDEATKPFEAAVVPTQPAAIAEHLRRHSEHADALVVLSEVVPMGTEYRCFVRQGTVFAHSSYMHPPPYRPAPPAVRTFAEAVARALLQATGMTMLTVDVSQHGDTLRLVEVGGVCSWGLYGADPHAFVAAMEAEALQRHQDLLP